MSKTSRYLIKVFIIKDYACFLRPPLTSSRMDFTSSSDFALSILSLIFFVNFILFTSMEIPINGSDVLNIYYYIRIRLEYGNIFLKILTCPFLKVHGPPILTLMVHYPRPRWAIRDALRSLHRYTSVPYHDVFYGSPPSQR